MHCMPNQPCLTSFVILCLTWISCTQLIDQPTLNILDLILTNVENFVHNMSVHSPPPLSISSDHFVITFDFASSLSIHSKTPSQTFWNYTRGDYIGLCTYFANWYWFYFFVSIRICWSCMVLNWSGYKKCNVSVSSNCI